MGRFVQAPQGFGPEAKSIGQRQGSQRDDADPREIAQLGHMIETQTDYPAP
jgi:hypothetical protein